MRSFVPCTRPRPRTSHQALLTVIIVTVGSIPGTGRPNNAGYYIRTLRVRVRVRYLLAIYTYRVYLTASPLRDCIVSASADSAC
jgi:hypothetical protein